MFKKLFLIFSLAFFSLFLCFHFLPFHSRVQKKDFTSDLDFTKEETEFLKFLESVKNQPQNYQKLLNEKEGLNLSPAIQQKWEKYLKEVIHSDLNTEQAIFIEVYQNYLQSIAASGAKLHQCTSHLVEGASWMEDLKKKFGINYIKEHSSDIQSILFHLQMKTQGDCLEHERKELLQAEAQFHEVVKDHLRDVLHFFESNDFSEAENIQIVARVRSIKIYYNLLNKASMARLIFLTEELRVEQEVKKLPQDLLEFLTQHPAFSKAFRIDPFKFKEWMN